MGMGPVNMHLQVREGAGRFSLLKRLGQGHSLVRERGGLEETIHSANYPQRHAPLIPQPPSPNYFFA
jgi:hypothetical protein